MKIDESAVGMPPRRDSADASIVGRRRLAEELVELVASADVVTGENIDAAEGAEQHVLGGPSSDSANLRQTFDRGFIAKRVDRTEVAIFWIGCEPREFDQILAFLPAEPQRAECVGIRARYRLAGRERS